MVGDAGELEGESISRATEYGLDGAATVRVVVGGVGDRLVRRGGGGVVASSSAAILCDDGFAVAVVVGWRRASGIVVRDNGDRWAREGNDGRLLLGRKKGNNIPLLSPSYYYSPARCTCGWDENIIEGLPLLLLLMHCQSEAKRARDVVWTGRTGQDRTGQGGNKKRGSDGEEEGKAK
jgi:hypothetical protein